VSPFASLEFAERVVWSPSSISFKVVGYRTLRGGDSLRTRLLEQVPGTPWPTLRAPIPSRLRLTGTATVSRRQWTISMPRPSGV